jgi:PAT family beta-lactamase induction signal transducer AmpG
MEGHQKPGSGLANSTSIAYFSGLAYKAHTETQYALLSSLMLLTARFIGGFSGDVVDAQGYVFFFIYTAMPGIPAIMLILYLMKRNSMENAPADKKHHSGQITSVIHPSNTRNPLIILP